VVVQRLTGKGQAVPRSTLWRVLWALPCTAVGLLMALLLWPAGARARRVQGVIEVAFEDGMAADVRSTIRPRRSRSWLPFTAITFGHVVIGTSRHELQRLRVHEHAHVEQYERWGPLFLIAYPLASLWQGVRGRRVYRDNPFEQQARRVERQAAGDGVERA
jgi:hypothetical protein